MKKGPLPGGRLPDRDLLISKEVIAYFGFCYRTLMRHIATGQLQPYKRGGILYFRRDDIIRMTGGDKEPDGDNPG